MLLTEEQLREIIDGCTVGDVWPYSTGTAGDIEGHLKRIVSNLERHPLLSVEADFNHYGSGFASYVHVFCTKSGRRAARRVADVDWIDGLALYLCRLAPLAAWGLESRTRHATGGSFGMPRVGQMRTLPQGDWSEEVHAIENIVTEHGLSFPSLDELKEGLPFSTKIRTNFGSNNVFDALFYWDD